MANTGLKANLARIIKQRAVLRAIFAANRHSSNQAEGAWVSPDWCSLGVVLRVLLLCNGLAALAVLWPWRSLAEWANQFSLAAWWLEPVLFSSLLSLCLVRRYCPSMWVQRFAAGLIPPVLTLFFGLTLNWFFFFDETPANLILTRALWAGAMGLLCQHYLELRAHAFSPALAEARLQALQARIRPHFLFNSLNAVLGMIRSDPRLAESTLEDLADLFRELLREQQDLVPLENEISVCQRYLAIEKLRLGERLQVEWQLAKLPQATWSPSLLLQPLLENAVHHGIEPNPQSGVVRIKITGIDKRVKIQIRNPYLNNHASTGNHMALENIRARLALLYDVEATLMTRVETVASTRAATTLRTGALEELTAVAEPRAEFVVTLIFPQRPNQARV